MISFSVNTFSKNVVLKEQMCPYTSERVTITTIDSFDS